MASHTAQAMFNIFPQTQKEEGNGALGAPKIPKKDMQAIINQLDKDLWSFASPRQSRH